MDPRMKIPGPDHPITIEPSTSHVTVRSGERVVADSRTALVLREAKYPPVYYVPLADVDPKVLRPSSTSTYCPFKGDASYYDIVGSEEGETVSDAIWTYEKPYDAVAEIEGHVAFYADRVQISVEA
jgi:uncharacterized protein (DUF427 family)